MFVSWVPKDFTGCTLVKTLSIFDKRVIFRILQPGFFMKNYEGTIGTITAGVLKAGLRPEATVQLIVGNSTQIPNYTFFAGRRRHWPGRVAGQYLSSQNPNDYTLPVVGDILTMAQQELAYKKAKGQNMPSIPKFLARILYVHYWVSTPSR
jgi:hypothetical protein